ncbi:MAG TPA: hypothetical protein VHS33_06265 [Sphingomicrobium sp.]|nr:hypothetical protein [Sphingomicrobium sp.]
MRPSGSPMPGVGATVGSAAGDGAPPAGSAAGAVSFPVAAGAAELFWAGALAGACAAAGVSQAAANAIAHPIRLITTPGNILEPETQVRASFAGSIGAAFESLKRLIQHDGPRC